LTSIHLSSDFIPQRGSTNSHRCASAFDYFQVIHYCRIP
jgi:hypothetical protein